MAGLIPQRFIDDLLDRVDIVDVIGARLELRKTGKNHSARCPFHDEKTPSFSVNPEKQFYYCFGCGAGGNAFGFVMDYDHVDFPQAVETLGALVSMEVPREAQQNNPQDKRRKALYDILDQAKRFYQHQLRQHNTAHQAVDYLKQRGLSGEIAATFEIGYAPPGWDNLLLAISERRLQQSTNEQSNDAIEDETIALLTDSGLLVNRVEENKRYDRFRERIIFPIRDTRGRTIAFGGRVLGDDKPKYLNSPETAVFHKGRELYGLYEANRSRQSNGNLLVVEGYMDVVALAQHEIENAVATLGTAVSDAHLEKLFRYTSEVVFCFDGDNAGRKAGKRALETSLPLITDGRSAKFLFLDEGEDPDTLVRKIGNERFRNLISNATPLSAFLFTLCEEGLDLSLADDCARFATLAAPMINQLPAGIFQQLLLDQLAKKTGLATDTLIGLLAPPVEEDAPQWNEASPPSDAYESYGDSYENTEHYPADDNYPPTEDYAPQDGDAQRAPKVAKGHTTPVEKDLQLKPLHCLIALLINHPSLAQHLEHTEALLKLEFDDIDILQGLFSLLEKNPDYTLNHILGYWRGVHGQEQGEVLAGIAATDLANIPSQTADSYVKQAQDIADSLLRSAIGEQTIGQRIEYLSTKSQLNDHDRNTVFSIWLELPNEERSPELINKIKQLLERKDETTK
ncbi:DNA primase [Gammaproteobacteria bacterium 50_400_T64]|nr:DNA primase [Gammaproteobacteria bacterium 50_400_T64]